MKKTKLFSFNRFCWALIITILISYGVNWYYTPKKPIISLDEWGEPLGEHNDGLVTEGNITVDMGSGVSSSLYVRGTSYTDGGYSPLEVDSTGALWVGGTNDGFGSSWRVRTTEQGYLQCENIDNEKWALIPKEELDKFKAYISQQLR